MSKPSPAEPASHQATKLRRPKRGPRNPGRVVATVLALMSFGVDAPQVPAGEEGTTSSVTLKWRNGEVLSGRFRGAAGQLLHWQSPLFAAPLSLDMAHLEAVEFPRPAEAAAVSDPMQFVLRNRDSLYGSLAEVTDQHMVLDSQRHGRCRLLRSAVRSFHRREAATFFYEGPHGTSGWKTVTQGRTLSQWKTGSEGQLIAGRMGAELFRPFEIASVAEVELWIQWTQRPGFVIGLATAEAGRLTMEGVKLETWGKDLVLQAMETQGDFTRIDVLDQANSGSLRIRLLWERPLGRMSLYSLEGELLAQLSAGKPGNDNTGLYILNKGADLTITRVRISQSGHPAPPDPDDQTLIHLVDDTRLRGVLAGFDRQDPMLRITGTDGKQHRVPIDRIAGVFLGQDQQEPSATARTQVAFHDGSLLRGTLLAAEHGKLSLETEYASEPLVSELKDIRQLTFLVAEPETAPQPPTHWLEYPGGKLRGTLGPSDIAGLPLAWQPPGATRPVPLRQDALTHVTRIVDAEKRSPSELPDRLYLANGDLLPCRIRTVDAVHVHVETRLAESPRIPRDRVKAMELGSEGGPAERGFGNGQWEERSAAAGAVELTANEAVFHGSATLRHRTLRAYRQLRFTAHWQQGNVAMTIGPDWEGAANRPGVADQSLLLDLTGTVARVRSVARRSQLIVRQPVPAGRIGGGGMGAGAGVMGGGMMGLRADDPFMAGPGPAAAAVPAVVEGDRCKAEVIVHMHDDAVEVLINGRQAYRQRFLGQQPEGRLTLTVQYPHNAPESRLLTLSDFQAEHPVTSLRTLSLGDEQARGVLTVPRHRRDNPPTHVLVANNGDLLRGRLIGLDATDVHFVSRLTDLRMPRERLAGIIWLESLEDAPPLPESAGDGEVRILLDDESAITFTPQQIADNRLVGHSAVLGRCSVPLDGLRRLDFNRDGNENVQLPFADWKLRPATEPEFPGSPGEQGEPPAPVPIRR